MANYDLGTAQGEIALDFNEQGIKDAESGLSKFAGNTAKVAAGIIATVAAIGTTIAGMAVAGGISRVLNIEDAQAKLKGLGHDAESVTTIMNDALNAVRGTAFGLDEAATIAASAVAAGIKPGQELEKYLKLTADAATIAGSSLSDMGTIINQTTTSGVVMTDNLNQLADRGIPIFQWLADEYGVTAVEFRKMVEAGEVDSATFRKVIEENIGGAALTSGQTTRGAMKNAGAALSRLGAMFVAGPLTQGPTLFMSIQNALDRLAAALEPVAAQFSAKLTPAIQSLAGWIDSIDFGPFIQFLIDAATNAAAFVTALMAGDFDGVGESLGQIGSVIQPLWPLFVALAEGLGAASGAIGQLIGAGINLIIPLIQGLADAMNWLGENSELIAPLILAAAGAFLLFKANQALATAAALASIPVRIAELALMAAQTAANNRLATAMNILTGAQRTNTATTVGSRVAMVTGAAAALAARVATLASAAATGVATAAQWALNTAMKANPIGIIIGLIAALVAGLIWFFTQTELGQDIWKNVTDFMAAAWEALIAVLEPIFAFIGDLFVALWDGAVAAWDGIMMAIDAVVQWFQTYVQPIIDFVIMAIVAYFTFLATIIFTVWNAIQTAITAVVNWFQTNVAPVIEAVVNLIVAIFTFLGALIGFIWNTILTTISGVVTAVVDWIVATWGAIVGFITPIFEAVWNFLVGIFTAIYDFIAGIVETVVGYITDRWNMLIAIVTTIFLAVYTFLMGIFNDIYNFVSEIVNNVTSFISDTWNGLVDTVRGIFEGVMASIEEPLSDVMGFFEGIYDDIMSFFSDAGSWLMDIGGDIIGGLIAGIEGALGWLTDTLNGITAMIPQEKGPPAKDRVLLEENGGLIMQGLMNGLRSEIPAMRDLLGGLTADLPSYLAAGVGGGGSSDNRQFNYYAAPGAPQIDGQEELMVSLKRSKLVAGW